MRQKYYTNLLVLAPHTPPPPPSFRTFYDPGYKTTLFEHSKAQNKPSMRCLPYCLSTQESSFKNNRDIKICIYYQYVCTTNLPMYVVCMYFYSIYSSVANYFQINYTEIKKENIFKPSRTSHRKSSQVKTKNSADCYQKYNTLYLEKQGMQ